MNKENSIDKLDRLTARCEAHRNDNRGRTRKKGNTHKLKSPSQLNSMPNTVRATAEPSKDTNQSKKVPQTASSGHASTTKQEKSSQQAQTSTATKSLHRTIDQQIKETYATTVGSSTPKDNPNKARTSNPQQKEASQQDINELSKAKPRNKLKSPAGQPEKTESRNGKKDGSITTGALTSPGANKLRHRQDMRELIFQMLAAGYGTAATARQVYHESGIRITRQNVDGIKHKNPDLIEKYRGNIAKDITLCAPVASKARRIVERQELINSLKRQIWKVTGKPGKRVITGLHEQINRILDSVKAELEPYEVNLTHGLQEQTAAQFKDLDDKSVINTAMEQLRNAGMEIAVVVPPKEQT